MPYIRDLTVYCVLERPVSSLCILLFRRHYTDTGWMIIQPQCQWANLKYMDSYIFCISWEQYHKESYSTLKSDYFFHGISDVTFSIGPDRTVTEELSCEAYFVPFSLAMHTNVVHDRWLLACKTQLGRWLCHVNDSTSDMLFAFK